MSKLIPLFRAIYKGSRQYYHIKDSIIDDHLYEIHYPFHWNFKSGYACRSDQRGNHKFVIFLHREVFGLGPNFEDPREIDHINHDSLDNRLENLRIADRSQNQLNSLLRINNNSGYKGVVPYSHVPNTWQAQVRYQKRWYSLGVRYKSKEEAALAYNYGASFLGGPFANLNPILPGRLPLPERQDAIREYVLEKIRKKMRKGQSSNQTV